MLIGFSFGGDYQRVPLGESASRSVTGMWNVTKATVDTVTKLFYDESARKNLSGVVGSYETTRQSIVADDVERSPNHPRADLIVPGNCQPLPLPSVGRGHIFWALAEKLRGAPDPVPHHGAGQLRRVRIGPDAVRREG